MFFAQVNVFTQQILILSATDNVNQSNVQKPNSSDRLIILSEENIAFLKEQVNQKDKVINSLLNQLSKDKGFNTT